MNQNEREGQSTGRTTGASGKQAEQQQNRTIEGQDAQPGKVWQEGDRSQSGQDQYQGKGGSGSTSGGSQYGGQGSNVGGSDPGSGSDAGIRGGFDQTRADKGSYDQGSEDRPENEPMDEGQWQGSRFSQGGSGNSGGSNG